MKGDKEVGYITSSVRSPRLGATIALGYVRKETNEIGAELMVRSGAEEIRARIVGLPF
jgi:glycine cleavage system aminomethyltransferase T